MTAPDRKRLSILLVHGGPGMDDSYFSPYLDPLRGISELTSYRQRRKASLDELCVELADKSASLTEPAILLGHSLGSILILETLRRYALSKVRGIILVSCGIDTSMNEAFVANMQNWKPRPLNRIAVSPDDAMKISCLESVEMFFSSDAIDRGISVLDAISYCAESVRRFYLEYLADFDLKPILRELKIPVLNLYGQLDYRIPATHSEKAAALNPLIHNVEVPQAGHFPFVDQPQVCCEAIERFLYGGQFIF